jgi:hypothetical protein
MRSAVSIMMLVIPTGHLLAKPEYTKKEIAAKGQSLLEPDLLLTR